MRQEDVENTIEPIIPVQDSRAQEIVLGFESIGEDCEFGLVQRKFQAEPISLFRWNTTRIEILNQLLETEFEGFGQPNTLALERSSWGEYFIRDRKHGFNFHTWSRECGPDGEEGLFHRNCVRINWLRDKFLADLRQPEKIFVYKLRGVTTDQQIFRLSAALRAYGESTLLIVDEAKQHKTGGQAELLSDSLIRAYLDHFGPDPVAKSWNIAFGDWLRICETALELKKRGQNK